MGPSPIVKFPIVEMLQNKKTAPVSAGLKLFVGVARSGEKGYKIGKGTVRRTTRKIFLYLLRIFCGSFIFNKLTDSAAPALCSGGNFVSR